MHQKRLAFTLFEMLMVVTILAVVSGAIIVAFGNTEQEAGWHVTQSEIGEIKKAMLRFKQDTGFLPRTGPFRLVSEGGMVPVPTMTATVLIPAAQAGPWFYSPANFAQLYENPLLGTGHPLATWNPESGRGWRGPYLSQQGEGYVAIGESLLSNGAGDPLVGSVLPPVPGVADPFVKPPVLIGSNAYFQWMTFPGQPREKQGRPYLYFEASGPDPYLQSAGVDGQFLTSDDVIVYLLR